MKIYPVFLDVKSIHLRDRTVLATVHCPSFLVLGWTTPGKVEPDGLKWTVGDCSSRTWASDTNQC